MFCICCLGHNSPYITLTKCVHKEFLNTFTIPNLNPPLELLVCGPCHVMLKKIYHFKMQIEDSFSLLLKQAYNIEKKETKNRISKIVQINIPDIPKSIDIPSEKITRLKYMETALNIINTNTTTFKSLTIFETLLKATSQNLNLENLTVLPNENKKREKVASDDNVSDNPLDLLCRPQKKPRLISKEDKIDLLQEKVASDENVMQVNKNEFDMLPVVKEDIVLSEVNKRTENTVNDSSTLLPHIKMKKETENELENTDIYGTAGLPTAIKDEPEIILPINDTLESTVLQRINKNSKESVNDCNFTVLPDSSTKFTNTSEIGIEEIEINNIDNNIDNNIETNVLPEENKSDTNDLELNDSSDESINLDDAASSSISKSGLSYIKLTEEELLAEREAKLKSEEYLNGEFRCQYCILSFEYKINLDDHINRKHELKPNSVTCKICKQIVFILDLEYHKFRHYNRIECDVCKRRFALSDEANEHYKKIHKIKVIIDKDNTTL